ncbi:hypothetical protein KDH_61390 [Dictyobacter sp. S3.2.2.5]|uniref:Uncharacterized protein n=1 Tax=Dictyobacter halimunensis TaxID=3026934 RepID=A0ABQ6FZV0_9CHLR|nr:hypothetical protein KDH_61390 [Dictyobacter sp. S3.2.2.5]
MWHPFCLPNANADPAYPNSTASTNADPYPGSNFRSASASSAANAYRRVRTGCGADRTRQRSANANRDRAC